MAINVRKLNEYMKKVTYEPYLYVIRKAYEDGWRAREEEMILHKCEDILPEPVAGMKYSPAVWVIQNSKMYEPRCARYDHSTNEWKMFYGSEPLDGVTHWMEIPKCYHI